MQLFIYCHCKTVPDAGKGHNLYCLQGSMKTAIIYSLKLGAPHGPAAQLYSPFSNRSQVYYSTPFSSAAWWQRIRQPSGATLQLRLRPICAPSKRTWTRGLTGVCGVTQTPAARPAPAQHLVAVNHRVQAVSNGQGGAVREHALDGVLHHCLSRGVHGCSGLVQAQHRHLAQGRTRQAHQLLLTQGPGSASSAIHMAVQTTCRVAGMSLEANAVQHLPQLSVAELALGVQVAANRAAEHHRLLKGVGRQKHQGKQGGGSRWAAAGELQFGAARVSCAWNKQP